MNPGWAPSGGMGFNNAGFGSGPMPEERSQLNYEHCMVGGKFFFGDLHIKSIEKIV